MTLQERAKRIVTQPRTEWPVIEAETIDAASLYKSYIAPLAAIPAICGFIGFVVFGAFGYRFGIAEALRYHLVQYIMQLLGVYVGAVIVSKLAPTFNSRESLIQALKLVAYSSTPVWLAGVLNLIPGLGFLVILAALYCVYVYYLGVPVLMKTPADKIVTYMVVSVLAIIIAMVLLSIVFRLGAGASTMAGGI